MTEATHRRRGVLFVAAAALLWSTGGIGIKGIPDAPLKVVFYRSAIAAVALFLMFRPRFYRRPGFLMALVFYAGCLITFVVATKWTTAANAIFLQYSGVIWVMLLSPLLLKEPMRRRDVIAVLIALAGLALFFVGELDTRGRAGNLMGLLSSFFFAGLVITLRRERGLGAEAAVTWGNVVAALVILPFIASDLAVTARSATVLLFMGVVQLACAYAFFVAGIKHVTATEASLIGMLEPIANPIWVLVFLGEEPSAAAIVGGVIVLAAIAWRTLTAERQPATQLPPPD